MQVDRRRTAQYNGGQAGSVPSHVAPRPARRRTDPSMRQTPTEQIQEAIERQLPAALVFRSEAAALVWASAQVAGVLRQAWERAATGASAEVDVGYMHAKDLGTRPRRQRVPWMDTLVKEVAGACFCRVVPLTGTMSSWLVGTKADRLGVLALVGSLIPTAETLGQEAYLREYHAQRRAGSVEDARGFKAAYHARQVREVKLALAQQTAGFLAVHPEASETFRKARLDVTTYMNENFLPLRNNKNLR